MKFDEKLFEEVIALIKDDATEEEIAEKVGMDISKVHSYFEAFEMLKQEGVSDKKIAEKIGVNLVTLRLACRVERVRRKHAEYQVLSLLRDKGVSCSRIAEFLGYSSESAVRAVLARGDK